MDLMEVGGFKATRLTIKEPQHLQGRVLGRICSVATNPKGCPKALQGPLVQVVKALC